MKIPEEPQPHNDNAPDRDAPHSPRSLGAIRRPTVPAPGNNEGVPVLEPTAHEPNVETESDMHAFHDPEWAAKMLADEEEDSFWEGFISRVDDPEIAAREIGFVPEADVNHASRRIRWGWTATMLLGLSLVLLTGGVLVLTGVLP